MAIPLLLQLGHTADSRDRALFHRLCLSRRSSGVVRGAVASLTHLAGARASVAAACAALAAAGTGASRGVLTLIVSHLIVQLIKRGVGRPRPVVRDGIACIPAPDRFSFPSGHAAAALSLALLWSALLPAAAPALLTLAVVVGLTRVALGVHYPGDVVAGQIVALLTWLALAP